MLGTRSHGRGRQSGQKSPRRGGSWLCPELRRPGADPSWLCMTSPTCECTWPKNHPVLYSGTEGRGYVRRTHPAQGQNCPKESSQLLPSRLLRSPLSQRRQEELTAKAATGTRAEVASPGRQEKHQHLGRNKHEPTHPHKSLCSGKWRVTCFKNKKYLMKMNHENESWPFVTREGQTTTAASAEQLCVPGRLKWKDPDTTVPVWR